MVPVPWSECRRFYTPLLGRKGNTAPNEPSHKALSGTLVLLLSAWESLLSGKKRASLAQSCWQWHSLPVLLPRLLLCAVLPVTTVLFSLCVPTTQPTHPPAFLGKAAEPELCSLPLGTRAPHCSLQGHRRLGCQGMSLSHVEFFQLWNRPGFLKALAKDEASKKAKEP